MFLEIFLPWDLEALFTSGLMIQMARATDSRLLESHLPWIEKTFMIFDEIASKGNPIAEFRKFELQKLDEMLNHYAAAQTLNQASTASPQMRIL